VCNEHVLLSQNETKTSIKLACGDGIMIRFVNMSLRVTQRLVLITRSAWDVVRTTHNDRFHDTKRWHQTADKNAIHILQCSIE
jgi:hypothetical protein